MIEEEAGWTPRLLPRSGSQKIDIVDGSAIGNQTKPADNPAGFSFAFAWRGELLTVPFKLMHLGAADATSEASLAAHRCSKRL